MPDTEGLNERFALARRSVEVAALQAQLKVMREGGPETKILAVQAQLEAQSGSAFDPAVVAALLTLDPPRSQGWARAA